MMFRYAVLCLCVAVAWTLPPPKGPSKIIPSAARDPRIFNGNPARQGQFPWEAAITFVGANTSFWDCGGTIISENWIVSTGHCARDAYYAMATTGAADSVTGFLNIGTEIIVHERFDQNTLANDISLIGFRDGIVKNDYTAPITLAEEPLGDGVTIRVSGFGDLRDDEAGNFDLYYTDLVTISNSECNSVYGGAILDEMVCAVPSADEASGLCYGDTGSAGVINSDTDPVFVAINGFISGAGCDAGDPSGFTRVANYRDWIREKTGI